MSKWNSQSCLPPPSEVVPHHRWVLHLQPQPWPHCSSMATSFLSFSGPLSPALRAHLWHLVHSVRSSCFPSKKHTLLRDGHPVFSCHNVWKFCILGYEEGVTATYSSWLHTSHCEDHPVWHRDAGWVRQGGNRSCTSVGFFRAAHEVLGGCGGGIPIICLEDYACLMVQAVLWAAPLARCAILEWSPLAQWPHPYILRGWVLWCMLIWHCPCSGFTYYCLGLSMILKQLLLLVS